MCSVASIILCLIVIASSGNKPDSIHPIKKKDMRSDVILGFCSPLHMY